MAAVESLKAGTHPTPIASDLSTLLLAQIGKRIQAAGVQPSLLGMSMASTDKLMVHERLQSRFPPNPNSDKLIRQSDEHHDHKEHLGALTDKPIVPSD